MADGPARVAAVGLGRWAKTLAGAIQKSAKIKIVNCFSRSEKSRQDFAQQYKCRSAKSYADLLSDHHAERRARRADLRSGGEGQGDLCRQAHRAYDGRSD